jgi:hypothetical protein
MTVCRNECYDCQVLAAIKHQQLHNLAYDQTVVQYSVLCIPRRVVQRKALQALHCSLLLQLHHTVYLPALANRRYHHFSR